MKIEMNNIKEKLETLRAGSEKARVEGQFNLHLSTVPPFVTEHLFGASRVWRAFLESREDFSAPKSHLYKCEPFYSSMLSFYRVFKTRNVYLLTTFLLRNVFVYKLQCELWSPISARKVSGLSRNALLSEIFGFNLPTNTTVFFAQFMTVEKTNLSKGY